MDSVEYAHPAERKHAAHGDQILELEVRSRKKDQRRQEDSNVEGHIGSRMGLVDIDKLVHVTEAESIAPRIDCAIPITTHREAWEPGDDREAQAPQGDKCQKCETHPSHVTCLEDAEELHQQRYFDVGSVGDIDPQGHVVALFVSASCRIGRSTVLLSDTFE